MLSSLMNLICAFLSFFLEYSSLLRSQINSDRKNDSHARRPNEKVNAGLRELEKVSGKFCFEVTTENGVAFFCSIAVQALNRGISGMVKE
jgi:hypothetical protein